MSVPMEPERKRLPDERTGITISKTLSSVGGAKIEMTTGEYPNGSLAEVFFRVGFEGTVIRSYELVAIAMSIGLQYGIPLRAYLDKFEYMRMEPQGMTSDQDFKIASSIIDLISKQLRARYCQPKERVNVQD